MKLPIFYAEDLSPDMSEYTVNEETSRHIVQVLRMKEGDPLLFTNGKGYLFKTILKTSSKKSASIHVSEFNFNERNENKVIIAISLIKNATRFEWFAEKAAETGVSVIQPLMCKRTEKQHFKSERIKNILISAMIQSQQTWLTAFPQPVSFDKFIKENKSEQKLIAHCEDAFKKELLSLPVSKDAVILIGPEGDFTNEEISSALDQKFIPVSLGTTRLRTETAGVTAAVLLMNKK